MQKYEPLPRSFYELDTITVAQQLLGHYLVRMIDNQILVGKIVETEAYHSNDAACHAFHGKTKANQALFGPVGHAYIYFIYGRYYCMNVVARSVHMKAGGVLIRALQPVHGTAYMQQQRQQTGTSLTSGPGKLTQALNITPALYGIDLTVSGLLYIAQGKKEDHKIMSSPRIGISKAQDVQWRFYVAHCPWVSK